MTVYTKLFTPSKSQGLTLWAVLWAVAPFNLAHLMPFGVGESNSLGDNNGATMQTLSWTSIAFYCAFGIFVFYQQLHGKNFRGASQGFALALNLSAFAGMLTGVAYLIYYGWSVTWWAPIVIFFIGLLATIPAFLVERVVGAGTLSLGAFVGWPISAYFMFHYIPR